MKFLRPLLAPLLLLGLWSVPPAAAAELIMLERPGCAWCLRWDREIAQIYPKTAEGHQAPLRQVDVTQPWRTEERKAELKSIMRTSYAVLCLKNKKTTNMRR